MAAPAGFAKLGYRQSRWFCHGSIRIPVDAPDDSRILPPGAKNPKTASVMIAGSRVDPDHGFSLSERG
jgi:hypothetical protein